MECFCVEYLSHVEGKVTPHIVKIKQNLKLREPKTSKHLSYKLLQGQCIIT